MSKRLFDKYFIEIEDNHREEFLRRLRIDNVKVIFLLSLVGLGFLVLLYYLDFLRYQSGKLPGEPIYEFLFINHSFFLLFLIPVWLIHKNRATIKIGKYKHYTALSYAWVSIVGIILLTMAVLALWDRGSGMLYAVFIFLVNFVIILPHIDRIIFNVFTFLIFFAAIIFMYDNNPELLIINFLETLGVTIPAFVVSTYKYNNYIKQLTSEKTLTAKNRLIKKEQLRSENLLLNILPKSIAEELKENGKVQPKYYDSATIMFIDIVGFTLISKVLPITKLVEELDHCFTRFDAIIEQYDLEKIKTMGDAYICAGGVPRRTEDHAQKILKAAIDIVDFMNDLAQHRIEKKENSFKIRIGIHTGYVIAGVVGIKKFSFDIWGDTVNLAARVEGVGEAGKINISRATYDLIKDTFNCTPRGKIAIKNAGELEMFFVENRKG